MDELLHVDRLVSIALVTESLSKINPTSTSRAMQGTPVVQNVDLTTFKIYK